MSSRQRFTTGLVLGLSLAASVVAGMAAFPLQPPNPEGPRLTMTQWPHSEPGPLERQAHQLGSKQSAPSRVVTPRFEFPKDLIGQTTKAFVVARIILDAEGNVAESRVLTMGFERPSEGEGTADVLLPAEAVRQELAERTLETIRRWRYEPIEHAPLAMTVAVSYASDGTTAQAGGIVSGLLPDGVGNGIGGGVGQGAGSGVGSGVGGGVGGGVGPGVAGGVVGGIGAPRKILHVASIYPEEARAAGVQGVVVLEVDLDENGLVTKTRVLRSVPGLDQAAMDAVGQWRYAPKLLNGSPVPVTITVTINFALP